MPATLRPGAIETDAVIVGAGPVGLFQAFQLGLLEISAHIIDALPYPGGQCVELYADKPIYDIPGVPVCTGRELIDNLQKQLAPFQPRFHLEQLVDTVERQPDGRLLVATSSGGQFLTKTLFIAAGVGAFQARLPTVEGISKYISTQVHTHLPDPAGLAEKNVLILGDTDAALTAAIQLAEISTPPKSISLMHRRNVFVAEAATTAAFRVLVEKGSVRFIAGQLTGIEESNGHLTAVNYLDADGAQHELPVDEVLVKLGISPKLGPIAHWGLDMERRQIKVNTESFTTDVAGVYAVGDINTYPGKKKLILCGFHECVLAAFGAAALLFPGKKVLLQYTTTSTRLHTLLGVNSASGS
jgi:thioredoxin reductase (NADPH)